MGSEMCIRDRSGPTSSNTGHTGASTTPCVGDLPPVARRVKTPAPRLRSLYSFRSGSRASRFSPPPDFTKPAYLPSQPTSATSGQPLASRISRRVVCSAAASSEPVLSPRFRSNARGAKSSDHRYVLRSNSQVQKPVPNSAVSQQQLAECNSPDAVSGASKPLATPHHPTAAPPPSAATTAPSSNSSAAGSHVLRQ